jgi:ankyrin repeat protein
MMRVFFGACGMVLAILFFAGGASAAMSDSAFVELCENGGTEEVLTALGEGANVNAVNVYTQETALFYAVVHENPDITRALITYGADINTRNSVGETPLMRAIESYKNPEVIKLLLLAGSDVNAKSDNGDTPMRLARTSSSAEPMKLLRQYGSKGSVASKVKMFIASFAVLFVLAAIAALYIRKKQREVKIRR